MQDKNKSQDPLTEAGNPQLLIPDQQNQFTFAGAEELPAQEQIELSSLNQSIVEADDGSEPMDRSRHNLIDPTPDEIMAYMTDYMVGNDGDIAALKKTLQRVLNRLTQLEMRLNHATRK